ncbi:MAG TPA: ATP-dependent zinc metalloprotease FtsH [Spirochaetota bacterium]|nr:ATP-dependent zinc metalloprotease FtsH [Spirochaetota bacterium]OPZ39006.1 MAG: ATP-dependent zinc metalloprotease FtsH [Spirochaetes bacterium ADurb.BinA120]HNU90412.1 ATP-dependent zinc metalloprotease FtsH [Spirochaetota bacterium]HPI14450.1 ATP-dependent zinc metalloprotease FtsH [Spirochaetota bacterium]HPV96242.1 ATP-dependent zinc metalloprotease FtsH [Spirochaetota bacterium]
MNKTGKQIALLLLIVVLAIAIFKMNDTTKPRVEALQYSDFLRKVSEQKVKAVSIVNGKKISGVYTKGDKSFHFETIIPYDDPELMKNLLASKVEVKGEEADDNLFLKGLLNFLPWLFFFGLIWFFMIRQIQSTGNKAMSFGKSRARLNPETRNKVTFADVAGVDEAQEELGEVIDFLKDPKKFANIGAKIPKGVLLMGPPGTGKTLLARAIAGEAGVPFFSISGSDFVEMFVGVGASRVRDLFEQGKKNAPCIIFIDEIDAVGRLRGAGLGGGHDEREQTLNQLLVEMDGFETNEGVIIVAATNRPDVLDPALLRPGRFDRQVVVDTPDIKGREKILAVHSRKIPLSREVDLKVIARGTPGFTGADLANLVNEGALLAARRGKKRVSMIDLEDAKDKVLMGPERRSMLISNEEKEIIAYHESGHALLGLLTGSDPIHKVTVIPRGRALGLTMQLPKEEKHLHSRNYWLNQITVLFGGHVAESLKFKDVTTGSSNDLERATDIARRMVCEWGMSKKIGMVTFGKKNEQIFLGREIAQHRDYSETTAEMIDDEVKAILAECEKRARKLITQNKSRFEKIAQYLVERETLNAEEIQLIMRGEELPPMVNTASQKNGDHPEREKVAGVVKTDSGILEPVKP